MSKTENIKNKLLEEISSYDEKDYRENIAGLADSHGVNYTEFEGAGNDNFGEGNDSNTKTLLIVGIISIIVLGGGFFAYKKGVFNKILKKK